MKRAETVILGQLATYKRFLKIRSFFNLNFLFRDEIREVVKCGYQEVGKFQVGNSFLNSCFRWTTEKLERLFQVETLQHLGLSNYPFELHVILLSRTVSLNI